MDGSETRTGAGRRKMSGMSEMGGKETTGVFVVHPEIQNFFFFFFWGDVEGATSARDGRWMDAGRTLRITRTWKR
jgi:hypothetical protein